MGVLSAYALRVPQVREWLVERIARLRALWLALAAGLIGMILAGLNTYSPLIAIFGYTWIAAFFTSTLLLARLNRDGWFHQWLSFSGAEADRDGVLRFVSAPRSCSGCESIRAGALWLPGHRMDGHGSKSAGLGSDGWRRRYLGVF